MANQVFNTVDVLRLEVQADPIGLVNLVQNPNGELGGWGWLTPVADSNVRYSDPPIGPGPPAHLVFMSPAASVPSWWTTDPMLVVAGQWVAARWTSPWFESYYRVCIEWLNAAGAVISTTARTGYIASNGVQSYAAVQAPATTVACRLRFDLYSNTSGANPVPRSYMYFKGVTVAKAATSGALAGLGYLEPYQYLNILGPTHELTINRDELDVGLLTATVLDASLDPATADTLRPGRRVRVTALDGATWKPLFVGKLHNAKVTYDLTRAADKRVRIALSAVDNVAALAAVPRSEGVATITSLPYVLEGAGVPWKCNGFSGHAGATVVARNPNASALDQVAITRDSVRGYAWVDRVGVLQAWDAVNISTSIAATLDEGDYSALLIDYDTERCINTVNIKFLRINLATGETVEVPYGPYVDQASVDAWGVHSAEFTVQGITETEPNMAAYAAAVLAANGTPAVRVNEVALPISTTADVTKALIDLYNLVTVTNADSGIDVDMRVTGVEHVISTDKWLTRLQFATAGGVAPPQSTPSPSVAATAAVSPGVWQAYTPATTGFTKGASTVSARFARIGDIGFYRIKVVLGTGFALAAGAAFGLPFTLRTESQEAGADLRMTDVGTANYQLTAHQNATNVGVWGTSANGGYGGLPFVLAAGDFFYIEGYGEIQP